MTEQHLHDNRRAEAICLVLFNSVRPVFISRPHVVFRNDSRIVRFVAQHTCTLLGIWPHTPRYSASGELDPRLPGDRDLPWDEWQNPFNQDHLYHLCGENWGAFATMYGMIVDVSVGEKALSSLWPKGTDIQDRIWGQLSHITNVCGWVVVPSDVATCFVLSCRNDFMHLVDATCKYARMEHIEVGHVEVRHTGMKVHGLLDDILAAEVVQRAARIAEQETND